jgi:uncharacterized membrane protein (UPF0127 family)
VATDTFLSGMLRAPKQPYVLRNAASGDVLARHVELAVDSATRRRGLLGRESFAPGSALIIAPCSAIHMFSMRFAIDVVFVSKTGRVLKTCAAVAPNRIAFRFGAYAAIELPAGTLEGSRARPGEALQLSPQPT